MDAKVIAFPKRFTPRIRHTLTVPQPTQGAGDTWITLSSHVPPIPWIWGRFYKILAIIDADDEQPIDEKVCHHALTKFAIRLSRLSYGREATGIVSMFAVLEPSATGGFLYTILVEVPDHVGSAGIYDVANQAFADLISMEDEEKPGLAIFTGNNPFEIHHLMLRTALPENGHD